MSANVAAEQPEFGSSHRDSSLKVALFRTQTEINGRMMSLPTDGF